MNALWQKVNGDGGERSSPAGIRTYPERRTAGCQPPGQITAGSETWQFRATRGIWGWLHIDPASLTTASGAAVAESAFRSWRRC